VHRYETNPAIEKYDTEGKSYIKEENKIGIYVHIPFCHSKCSYCDFVSFPRATEATVNRYMNALFSEIQYWKENSPHATVNSIFIGGGTPSSISPEWIEKLMRHLSESFSIAEDAEISMEANPGTLTPDSIESYKRAGINRISLGLQSTQNEMLQTIGRMHSYETFLGSYQWLRAAGIDNINIDLIFGLPGQDLADWKKTLNKVMDLSPEHISAYALKVEEGTPMADWVTRGLVHLPDEDTEREMYHFAIKHLAEAGYAQYELSNFSRPGYLCRHNLIYWENKPYLGIGLAAHSKRFGIRFANTEDINEYCMQIEKGKDAVVEREPIDTDEDLFETIMLGLRLNRGLNIKQIDRQYGIVFLERYSDILKKLERESLIVKTADGIALTDLGRDLSNRVFLSFMND
jgi:oxygen-independent coproporphyrinogen-3 oxidase